MGLPTQASCSRNPLTTKHGSARGQSSPSWDLIPVVIEKFEVALTQFEQRDVGRRANIQRAAAAEAAAVVNNAAGRRGEHVGDNIAGAEAIDEPRRMRYDFTAMALVPDVRLALLTSLARFESVR